LIAALLAAPLSASAAVPGKAAAPPTAAPADPALAAEAAKRAKIFASPLWKQVDSEFQKWLSTQVIYTPDEVKALNAKIAAQLQQMPTDELQEFLDDWEAKLKILLGKNFNEAQDWLGVYMTNMADGYRKEYLKKMGLSDITKLTADQLQKEITKIRADQLSIKQNEAAFQQARQQQQSAIEQSLNATQSAMNQDIALRDTSPPDAGTSHYTPTNKFGNPPQMHFYVDGNGHIGYTLPW
jgi:hypothetical protein